MLLVHVSKEYTYAMPIVSVIARLMVYVGAMLFGSLLAHVYEKIKQWYKRRAKEKKEREREILKK